VDDAADDLRGSAAEATLWFPAAARRRRPGGAGPRPV